MATCFPWIEFCTAFADELLRWRNDRTGLLEKVKETYDRLGKKLPTLDSEPGPTDIDPFTVLGLFSRKMNDGNRTARIAAFKETFGMNAELPHSFEGLSPLYPGNATFYAFHDDPRRGERDIQNLWDLFEAALALGDHDTPASREAFCQAYDHTIGQPFLKFKLSMGLSCSRPLAFLSLDGRNRWYLGDKALAGPVCSEHVPYEKDPAPASGEEYLAICDAVRSQFGTKAFPFTSFPEISHAARVESERVNKETKEKNKADTARRKLEAQEAADGRGLGDADVETTRYWLYTPGKDACMWEEFSESGIMGLRLSEFDDLTPYDSEKAMQRALLDEHADAPRKTTTVHAAWQFAHEMKPGDVVFAQRGRQEILGRGVITSDYDYTEDGGDYPHVREVMWTHKGHWETRGTLAMKAFTDITKDQKLIAEFQSFFDSEDTAEEFPETPQMDYPAYTREDFLSDVFMDEGTYDTVVDVLRAKKNIILQGAPGVGKTYLAKRLAYSIMGVKDVERVQMVQFHQSYSYEDFIEGFRPSEKGFELSRGSFYSFCARAADDDDRDYFFIIDEINRGNLSKIFGELFMLIENDKRGPKNTVQLLYSAELFHVPANVHIIGTMNTADRSLALLDYALRRRFAFFDLTPGFSTEGFQAYRKSLNNQAFDSLIRQVEALNVVISDDDALGEGFTIGHSFFCTMKPESCTDTALRRIVTYELIPLLKEYWFDEPEKVREWSRNLLRSLE